MRSREQLINLAVAAVEEADRVLHIVWPPHAVSPTHDPGVAAAYAEVARAYAAIAALIMPEDL